MSKLKTVLTKQDFELVRFPNNEFKLVLKSVFDNIERIDWYTEDKFRDGVKITNPSERFMAIVQLNRIVGKYAKYRPVEVRTDFLFWKRQDKAQILGEVTTNDLYKSLNHLNFNEFAPHDSTQFSKETIAEYLKQVGNNDVLVLPDAGAYERFKSEAVDNHRDVITFKKNRDQETGKLVFEPLDARYRTAVTDKRVVIIDDIVAYGGTFKYIASQIKQFGSESIDLVINHVDKDEKDKHLYDSKDMKRSGISNIIVLNGGEREA